MASAKDIIKNLEQVERITVSKFDVDKSAKIITAKKIQTANAKPKNR